MNKNAKKRIDAMLAAGVSPARMKGSEGQALNRGRATIKLIGNDGEATAAGKYWTIKSGQPLPVGGFMQQVATREGNLEFIKLPDGRRGVTRKFDETTGDYKFTKLGNDYYKLLRRKYVASVPVIVKGERKNGSGYTFKSSKPIGMFGIKPTSIPLHLTMDQRRAKVKQMIEADIPENKVVYEVSKDTWTLDSEGSWLIDEETVGTNKATGEGESHVTLERPSDKHRRRRAAAKPVFSHFLFSEAICDEAFEEHDDKLCCPRQIAAVLKLDFVAVCEDLLVIERGLYQTETWEEEGCTIEMIIAYTQMHGLGCCIVHNEQVLETRAGNPILAFTMHEGHLYFYKSPRVRQALMARRTGAVTRLKKTQGATRTPIAADWKPWANELEAGHFYVDENDLALSELGSWIKRSTRR